MRVTLEIAHTSVEAFLLAYAHQALPSGLLACVARVLATVATDREEYATDKRDGAIFRRASDAIKALADDQRAHETAVYTAKENDHGPQA